jgi:hypothetical protein
MKSRWCQNPQFVVQIPKGNAHAVVNLKLVVRKLEKDLGRGLKKKSHSSELRGSGTDKRLCNVGLVLCKPPRKFDCRRCGRAADTTRTNAVGEPILLKESSLRRVCAKKGGDDDEDDDLGDFEGQRHQRAPGSEAETAMLDQDAQERVDRKMCVTAEEWCIQTHFAGVSESCVLFKGLCRSWMPHGMVVVPCLAEAGVSGQFELEVHSNIPLHVWQLPDAHARTLVGEWTRDTAGGGHLHQTWRKNPHFRLRFSPHSAPVRAKINLERPAAHWSSQVKRDHIGSMIGFYLFLGCKAEQQARGVTADEQPWNETPFVPLHEISSPENLTFASPPEGEDYYLMPCTLDPNFMGPFVLSVVSDVVLTLTLVREAH